MKSNAFYMGRLMHVAICVMIKYMIHLIDRSSLHYPAFASILHFCKNLLTVNNFHRHVYFSGEEEGGTHQGLTFLESAPNALSKEYDCSCKSSAKRKRLFKFFSKYYITKSYKLFQTFLPL